MPKVIAFIVVAIAIAWAAAFVDFGDASSITPSSTTPSPEPEAANERTASMPEPPRPDHETPRDEPTAEPEPQPEANDDQDDEAPHAAVTRALDERSAAMARALAAKARREGDLETNTAEDVAQLGERGQSAMSTEHNARMRTYASEPRDATWALAQEQALTELVRGTPFQSMHVHCRTSICQLILQTTEAESFEAFLALDGVRELTGADIDTPYSLRSSRLSFFFEPSTD